MFSCLINNDVTIDAVVQLHYKTKNRERLGSIPTHGGVFQGIPAWLTSTSVIKRYRLNPLLRG